MTARIVGRRAGVRQLLTEPGVAALVERLANQIAATAGPGHRVEHGATQERVRSAVITDTNEARHNEATNRTLTAAAGSTRL
jgi:hypothetical protein